MTQVIVRWANDLPDGVFETDVVLRCVPTKARENGPTVILPKGFTATGPAPLTIELAPTSSPDWVWRMDERVPGGRRNRYVAVPNSLTPVEYADLVEIDPATLEPLAEPQAAWWVALQDAQMASGMTLTQVNELIAAHAADPHPHVAYDIDMIDMATVFENGLI